MVQSLHGKDLLVSSPDRLAEAVAGATPREDKRCRARDAAADQRQQGRPRLDPREEQRGHGWQHRLVQADCPIEGAAAAPDASSTPPTQAQGLRTIRSATAEAEVGGGEESGLKTLATAASVL